MRRAQTGLIALGLLPLAYGAWLLLRHQPAAGLRQVTTWALAGVILHDAVLAPLAVGFGWFGDRLLPRAVASAAAVALLLIGTVSIVAIPVLDGHAAGGPNHTLLDRDYVRGWLLVVGVVLVATTAGAVGSHVVSIVARSRRRATDGSGTGGR